MTCIVGLIGEDGIVYLGADSFATADNEEYTLAEPKVCKKGDFVMGVTGKHRMLNLVLHAFCPPPIRGELMPYMVTSFVDALRECFNSAGWGTEEDGGEDCNGTILVGVHGHLFKVESNYSVVECQQGYQAIGCGGMTALGALWVLTIRGRVIGNDYEMDVRAAVEAARAHCSGVGGYVHVVHTEPGA